MHIQIIIMDILKKFKDLLIESLKDNKKLIIGLYVFFIICIVGAWILSAGPVGATLSEFQNMSSSTPAAMQNASAVDLFINNEYSGILVYVGSIFIGIPAIVSLLYNGINMGLIGQLFSQVLPNGGMKFLVYLIPHGIFELTATVLQSVAGILLFLFICRFIRAMISSETHGVSEAFDKSKKALVHSVILMIFATILLLIAAPIEAYISVPFSELILGTW